MMTKKILDVTCGSRTIWFNKNHPAAIYCDVRDEEFTGVWKSTSRDSERTCIVHPDVLCDFTDLPFPDNSFALVVFDSPHLRRVGENAWMRKKYGQLGENWRVVSVHCHVLATAHPGLLGSYGAQGEIVRFLAHDSLRLQILTISAM